VLTVTQLAWSHSGRFLAACSRDRTFTIHERLGASDEPFNGGAASTLTGLVLNGQSGAGSGSAATSVKFALAHKQKAAHARVLWGVSWAPGDRLIATGGNGQK
jgi:hypothetical protein